MARSPVTRIPTARTRLTGATQKGVYFSVAVAALGYFVDLYDIVIFGVVRVASLAELGATGADNTTWGIHLLNLQMVGMLLGGFAWVAATRKSSGAGEAPSRDRGACRRRSIAMGHARATFAR